MAMLVAMPVSVAWGAIARGWFGLPEDYAPAGPAFLIAATAAISSLVALAFALTVRTRAPRAVGSTAAVILLAIALPAWLVWPTMAYPHVGAGPTVGVVAHVLIGALSLVIVLRALPRRPPHEG